MYELKPNPLTRRSLFKSLVAVAVLSAGLLGCGGNNDNDNANALESKFYASWSGSMSDATQVLPGAAPAVPQSFNNQTVRHVLRLSLGGNTLRVKVSNLFGKSPITFTAVRVAKSTGLSSVDVSTDKSVTFNGQASVTLAAGTELVSDAVSLEVAPLTNIAVSMYFSSPTAMPTVHALGRQTAYIAAGNQTATSSIPAATADQRQSYYGLTSVEASSTQKTNVVVTFGDSITDGFNSTVDASKRYPNQLDDRLKAAGSSRISVVNQGISGNRWLNDVAGPSGNSRFDRDVLNVTGVTHAIILLGTNDLGFSASLAPTQPVTAEQVIAAMNTAIAKSKTKGIKVFVGTILPFKGTRLGFPYYTDAAEAKRQAINTFIRNSKEIDGVVDFAGALQNPADPLTINPIYDSGDGLHPNDAGYGAMAAAIDLSKLQ